MVLDAYDVEEGYAEESGGVWKKGMVGDYVVLFEQRFHANFPYPSISMFSGNTPAKNSNKIVVFYRSLKKRKYLV